MKTLIFLKEDFLEVAVDGRLDAATSEEFIEEVEKHLTENVTEIGIDCKKLEYISSAGLRALMALCDDLSDRKEKITLENVGDQVMEVLRLTGMVELFDFK